MNADVPLDSDQRSHTNTLGVRDADIVPYSALQYIARMLKILAVLVAVALVVEVTVGIATDGASALPAVLAEAVQFLMIAGGLWGAADLTHVIIDVGHDIRAHRILLGRVAARTVEDRGSSPESERRE